MAEDGRDLHHCLAPKNRRRVATDRASAVLTSDLDEGKTAGDLAVGGNSVEEVLVCRGRKGSNGGSMEAGSPS